MDGFSQFRVLIVEDECLIALDLAQLVSEFGYDVCALARTVEEAVAAAAKHNPDLVLTDVRLAQGSSGLDAARRIRDAYGTPSCFISGSIDAALVAQAQAQTTEPIGFLSKPFQPASLKAMLAKAALSRRPSCQCA